MLTLLAATFLACYSAYLIAGIYRRIRGGSDHETVSKWSTPRGSFWVVLVGTLFVTLLNPHVLVERIIILGAISTQIEAGSRLHFAAGAITASFVWFFFLSSLAAKLGSVLQRPRLRLSLDIVVAAVLAGFTIYLFQNLPSPVM